MVMIFLCSVGYRFILLIISFDVQKLKVDVVPFVHSSSYFLGSWNPIQKLPMLVIPEFSLCQKNFIQKATFLGN
jgi:hypothetical protein